jgi:HEAT repeat protein
MEQPGCGEALIQIVKQAKDKEVRRRALHSLADQDEPVAGLTSQVLRELAIKDADPEIRSTATMLIAENRTPESLAHLKEVLAAAKDVEFQEEVLQAIARIGGTEAQAALVAVAVGGTNEELARVATHALTEIEELDKAAVLRDVYRRAKFPEAKEAALDSMADEDDPAAIKALGRLLKEEKDREWREKIVSALGGSESDEAVPILLEAAKTDPEVDVRTAAVSALGDIKTPKARQALIDLLKGKKDAAGREGR